MELSNSNTQNDTKISINRELISSLLKQLDELPCAPSNEDEFWYLINKNFIDNLRSYESGETDNYPNIIKNRIFLEDFYKVNEKTRLLEEYQNGNGINFVLYPEEAINILEKYFKFDVKIPRAVYPYKKFQRKDKIYYKVDIQPLKITVYSKNPDEYSNPSKLIIIILKKYTIEDILIEINGGYKGEHLKRNLFFSDNIIKGSKREWQSIYINNNKEYTYNKKIGDFDINENCCFLITNERPDIKCLTNFSNNFKNKDLIKLKNDNNILNKSINDIFNEGGNRGLINLGNTCFINSSLQCLSKILTFSNYFLSGKFWKHINYSNPVGQHGKLAKAYYETLVEMWQINKSNEPYAPRILKQAISEKRDEFQGYQQHDSQELLAYLLDGLHEDLNLIIKKPYYEEKLQGGHGKLDIDVAEASWKRHKEINNSIIVDLFQGQYRSKLQCPECKKLSITFDPFMYLSIPIPSKKNHRIWFHVMLDANNLTNIRFSSSFIGNQEVLFLKMFFLDIIKNLKHKKKKIILHSKNIIKNNSNNQYGNSLNSFNFHSKLLDDQICYPSINDEKNDENNDFSNYVKIIKQKNKNNSVLKNSEINEIYDNICNMCDIEKIEDLEIEHINFFYTKMKNILCNDFFEVLDNTDVIIEPHNRIGQGISHIFIYIFPKIYNEIFAKMKLKKDDNYDAGTNSGDITRSTNEDIDMENDINITTEMDINEKKISNNKINTNKVLKKRKGILSNPLSKNDNDDIDEKCDYLEKQIEKEHDEMSITLTETTNSVKKNEIENKLNNGEILYNNENTNNDIVVKHCVNDNKVKSDKIKKLLIKNLKRREKEDDNNYDDNDDEDDEEDDEEDKDDKANETEVYEDDEENRKRKDYDEDEFIFLIIPVCKEEHIYYKMKNNDLPLLFRSNSKVTVCDLYEKVYKSYLKKEKKIINENLKNTEHENKLMNLLNLDQKSENKTNTSKTCNNSEKNTTKLVEDDTTKEHKLSNNLQELLKIIKLYLPNYYIKEMEASNEIGMLLHNDDNNYIMQYIKHLRNKIITIYLDSNDIDIELSTDIKTLTFMDLEEKYDIDTCLKLFSQEEQLDENNTWYCGNCKLHVQAFKKLDLFRMPNILILHLKRFNNTNRWLRSKIDTYVYYPHKNNEYLNMSPYILQDGLKHMKKLNSNYQPLYELIGVNCHTGGMCGGHYFAYVKLKNKWYTFNDTYVTTVDESNVNTKNAYLLFYQLLSDKNEDFSSIFENNLAEQAIALANASYNS